MKSSKPWYLEQSVMAMVNLQDTFAQIQASQRLNDDRKDELTEMLLFLFESAHAKMIQGREDNPIHHNTMVLYLMNEIALSGGYDYNDIKELSALSLLHDIGYVETTAKKWTSAEVKAAVKGKSDAEIRSIVAEAMQARDEHMRKGAVIVKCMLRKVNAYFQQPLFEEERIHAIGEVVAIHDRPSSAKLKEEYLPPADLLKDDLLPPKNELAKALRDSDRLWMATAQGVKKDLIFAGKEVTEATLKEKLGDNCESFKDEKSLYDKVYQTQGGVASFAFKGDTLFRTDMGYHIYQRLSDPDELMKETKRIADLAVDLETGLVKAFWRTKRA